MFKNRQQAGRLLAQHLRSWAGARDALVVAVPRGGVITAREVAEALKLPLEIVVVRKVGFPGNPELALGAVDLNGTVTLNEELSAERIDPVFLEQEIKEQLLEARRREKLYREGRKPLSINNQRIILVDDGIATGQTLKAAINYLRQEGAKEVILAAPVAAPDSAKRLAALADRTVILEKPLSFAAVGQFYQDFPQVTDEEVRAALKSEQ